MTRREFLLSIASAAGADPTISQEPLIVPVHLVLDGQAKWRPEQLHYFWSHIWPEAVRDLASCGIRLQSSLGAGEVWRHSGREPEVT